MIEQEGNNPQKIAENKTGGDFRWAYFMQLSTEFAVYIAAPLLIFIYLGPILGILGLESAAEWANHQKATSNLYRVSGLLLALFISFYSIFKKVKEAHNILK